MLLTGMLNRLKQVSPAYDPRDATVDDDVHYCSPCDRCFASAGELQNASPLFTHWQYLMSINLFTCVSLIYCST